MSAAAKKAQFIRRTRELAGDEIDGWCLDAEYDALREKEFDDYMLDRRLKEIEARIAKLEGAQS